MCSTGAVERPHSCGGKEDGFPGETRLWLDMERQWDWTGKGARALKTWWGRKYVWLLVIGAIQL